MLDLCKFKPEVYKEFAKKFPHGHKLSLSLSLSYSPHTHKAINKRIQTHTYAIRMHAYIYCTNRITALDLCNRITTVNTSKGCRKNFRHTNVITIPKMYMWWYLVVFYCCCTWMHMRNNTTSTQQPIQLERLPARQVRQLTTRMGRPAIAATATVCGDRCEQKCYLSLLKRLAQITSYLPFLEWRRFKKSPKEK